MMPLKSSVNNATIWRVTIQLSIIILDVTIDDRNMLKVLRNRPNKLEYFFRAKFFFSHI